MNEWQRTVDGTRLAIWKEEGGRRPEILLVHGLASNARLWDGVTAHFNASDRGTVQVDLRGHGLSDKPEVGYDFQTMAEDLAGLVDASMQSPVLAVGQSFGGNLVVELANRRPELVSSVVCVDGGFINLSAEFPSWKDCVAALTPPPLTHLTVDSLAEAASELYSGWPPDAISAQLANLEEAPDGSIQRRLALAHHLSILDAMYRQDPLQLAAACTRPVLVIAADDDRPGKQDHVNAFVKRLRRGREIWLRGHHDLHAEQPGTVVEIIEAALDEGFLR